MFLYGSQASYRSRRLTAPWVVSCCAVVTPVCCGLVETCRLTLSLPCSTSAAPKLMSSVSSGPAVPRVGGTLVCAANHIAHWAPRSALASAAALVSTTASCNITMLSSRLPISSGVRYHATPTIACALLGPTHHPCAEVGFKLCSPLAAIYPF